MVRKGNKIYIGDCYGDVDVEATIKNCPTELLKKAVVLEERSNQPWYKKHLSRKAKELKELILKELKAREKGTKNKRKGTN